MITYNIEYDNNNKVWYYDYIIKDENKHTLNKKQVDCLDNITSLFKKLIKLLNFYGD